MSLSEVQVNDLARPLWNATGKVVEEMLIEVSNTWEWYWLQNKVEDSASHFAGVASDGSADCHYASYSGGVRPVFLLS